MLNDIQDLYGRRIQVYNTADSERPTASVGLAFVLNCEITNTSNVTVKELILGGALLLTTTWHNIDTISILNIYAPNDYGEQRDFWERLQAIWDEQCLPKPDFMLGDFNLVEDPIDRSPPHADPLPPTDALCDMHLTQHLVDAWRTDNLTERSYTFYSSLNRFSRIDRIYSQAHHVPNLLEWYMGPTVVPTDHNMVSVRYAPLNAPYIGPGQWAWPAGMIHDKDLLQGIMEIGCKIERRADSLGSNPEDKTVIQLLWEELKMCSCQLAKQHAKHTLAKISNCIHALQHDLNQAANSPLMDISEDARTNTAILE
ncbi:DNase I-like protein, partial [Gloeophyllum trabeum ATCC 11539]